MRGGYRPKLPKVHRICERCKKNFDVFPYRASARWCSKVCWSQRNPPESTICITCGASFTVHKSLQQKFCSRSCARRGTRSNAYKDGRSLERDRARLSPQLKVWRESVYRRDSYTCRRCGASGILHAHHIERWADSPTRRFDVDNGLTLCEECHGREHGKNFANRRIKNCPDCGMRTSGRGKNGLCSSCAITRWHATIRSI